MTPNYQLIPARTMYSLTRWVTVAQPPGDFLYAVLSNNLKESYNRGDDENLRALYHITCWLYNHAPGGCWGSPDKVNKWEGMDWIDVTGLRAFENKWMNQCMEEV